MRTLRIDAPAARVWAVLADYGAIGSWAPDVDHSCLLTEQPDGVGSVRRIQTGRTVLRETITAWEPGTRLSYEITGLPPVVASVTTTWRLVTRDDGRAGTDVTVESDVTPGPRPPHRIAARVVGRLLGRAAERMLDGLARHLRAHDDNDRDHHDRDHHDDDHDDPEHRRATETAS